jgi:hypothetical protein
VEKGEGRVVTCLCIPPVFESVWQQQDGQGPRGAGADAPLAPQVCEVAGTNVTASLPPPLSLFLSLSHTHTKLLGFNGISQQLLRYIHLLTPRISYYNIAYHIAASDNDNKYNAVQVYYVPQLVATIHTVL